MYRNYGGCLFSRGRQLRANMNRILSLLSWGLTARPGFIGAWRLHPKTKKARKGNVGTGLNGG